MTKEEVLKRIDEAKQHSEAIKMLFSGVNEKIDEAGQHHEAIAALLSGIDKGTEALSRKASCEGFMWFYRDAAEHLKRAAGSQRNMVEHLDRGKRSLVEAPKWLGEALKGRF